MRDKLGILVVEDESGSVGVQLFENPDAAASSVAELKGRPGDSSRRATFLSLAYTDGQVRVEKLWSRDLPFLEPHPPTRFVVGEGPKEE